jgi:hypothetical protein
MNYRNHPNGTRTPILADQHKVSDSKGVIVREGQTAVIKAHLQSKTLSQAELLGLARSVAAITETPVITTIGDGEYTVEYETTHLIVPVSKDFLAEVDVYARVEACVR